MVILISGKMGSGKTTLGESIRLQLLKDRMTHVEPYSFASIIYEMHDAIREIGDKYNIPRVEPKDGNLLQLLGTEWGRKLDPDIWVRAAKHHVSSSYHRLKSRFNKVYYIIADARFENEFEAFGDNTITIRLECSREERKRRCSMWRERDDHPSEVSLDSYSEQGKFDLTFDTEDRSVEWCTNAILEEIAWRR